MFLRKRIVNGTLYWSIVRSFREDGRVKQQTIQHLGNTNKAIHILKHEKDYACYLPIIAQHLQYGEKRGLSVHFSSNTDEWETPTDFYNELNAEFGFTLDVCASPYNTKCHLYYTSAEDGLNHQWRGTCWMNPPYGRAIANWVEKAYNESLDGATVVCLLPARTDTKWWHDYCTKGEIRFQRGRIKFGKSKHNAPFPSAVVVFRGNESNL